jgi:hypothetical protein
MLRTLLLLLAFSVPYPHVQAEAAFSTAPPDSRTVDVRIHLHNTGDLAASCIVRAGGQKKVTGVSANGDAYVFFDGVTNYKGYTFACSVD